MLRQPKKASELHKVAVKAFRRMFLRIDGLLVLRYFITDVKMICDV